MSRIVIPTRDDAPEASRPILDTLNKQLGFTPNLFAIMSLSPNALTGWAGLQAPLAKTLDQKIRDGIALAVSQVNECHYCLSAHTYVATNFAKMEAEEIALNRRGRSNDVKKDAAVHFAKKLIELRGKVTEVDLGPLLRDGPLLNLEEGRLAGQMRAQGGRAGNLAMCLQERAFVRRDFALNQRERQISAENDAALTRKTISEARRHRSHACYRHAAERDASEENVEPVEAAAQFA